MPDVPPRVLILERNEGNRALLKRFLEQEGYRITAAGSLEALDLALDGDPFDMAILDVAGFGAGFWERCQMLRQRKTPFLVVSPGEERQHVESVSLQHGAAGVLSKPLSQRALAGLLDELVAGL